MAVNRPNKLIGPTNMNDPRLQRQILSAGANPLRNQLGATQDITANFVNQDIGTRLGFHQLGEQEARHKSSLSLANRRLGLQKNTMDFQKKMFKQSMHDKRQELGRDMLLGIGTAGWSFLEGRRRSELIAEESKEKKELIALMKKHYGGTT